MAHDQGAIDRVRLAQSDAVGDAPEGWIRFLGYVFITPSANLILQRDEYPNQKPQRFRLDEILMFGKSI